MPCRLLSFNLKVVGEFLSQFQHSAGELAAEPETTILAARASPSRLT
jgi:hypothetical protein